MARGLEGVEPGRANPAPRDGRRSAGRELSQRGALLSGDSPQVIAGQCCAACARCATSFSGLFAGGRSCLGVLCFFLWLYLFSITKSCASVMRDKNLRLKPSVTVPDAVVAHLPDAQESGRWGPSRPAPPGRRACRRSSLPDSCSACPGVSPRDFHILTPGHLSAIVAIVAVDDRRGGCIRDANLCPSASRTTALLNWIKPESAQPAQACESDRFRRRSKRELRRRRNCAVAALVEAITPAAANLLGSVMMRTGTAWWRTATSRQSLVGVHLDNLGTGRLGSATRRLSLLTTRARLALVTPHAVKRVTPARG